LKEEKSSELTSLQSELTNLQKSFTKYKEDKQSEINNINQIFDNYKKESEIKLNEVDNDRNNLVSKHQITSGSHEEVSKKLKHFENSLINLLTHNSAFINKHLSSNTSLIEGLKSVEKKEIGLSMNDYSGLVNSAFDR